MPSAPNYDFEIACRACFLALDFVGTGTLSKLISHFGSASNAWEKLSQETANSLSWSLPHFLSFKLWRLNTSPEGFLLRIKKETDFILAKEDSRYPANLLTIADPPWLIFGKGCLVGDTSQSLAVVGSRCLTAYGRQVVELLLPGLVGSGLAIVSGLALGADAAAHQATLDYGGRTVAILAGGIDQVAPAANYQLAQSILKSDHGALISERPPGWQAKRFSFPVRNRLIAGWSLGVLVIEAAENSGSLHTVNSALEQGRDVFAVPGPINSQTSLGTNRLIQQGAKLVIGSNDVLTELGLSTGPESIHTTQDIFLSLNEKESQIVSLLRANQGITSTQLSILSATNSSQINSTLTLLELKGIISCQNGCWFCK